MSETDTIKILEMNSNVTKNKLETMEKKFIMPDVVVDLTDETKTVEEAIADCETARQAMKQGNWFKRLTKRVKRLFKK